MISLLQAVQHHLAEAAASERRDEPRRAAIERRCALRFLLEAINSCRNRAQRDALWEQADALAVQVERDAPLREWAGLGEGIGPQKGFRDPVRSAELFAATRARQKEKCRAGRATRQAATGEMPG